MANIHPATDENVYQIKRWLGVNEAPEGEATLKMGEAALMRNFSVTAGGALKKRAGSANVAGLLNDYVINEDELSPEILLTELNKSTATFNMYPAVEVDGVGNLTLTGIAVAVSKASSADYIGYYFMSPDGLVHKFTGVTNG